MAHIHAGFRPAARRRPGGRRRAPVALALPLAAPATSLHPALTTGPRGTGTAISFPHGFPAAQAVTARPARPPRRTRRTGRDPARAGLVVPDRGWRGRGRSEPGTWPLHRLGDDVLAAVAAGLPSATAPRIALPSKRHGEANKQGMARMPSTWATTPPTGGRRRRSGCVGLKPWRSAPTPSRQRPGGPPQTRCPTSPPADCPSSCRSPASSDASAARVRVPPRLHASGRAGYGLAAAGPDCPVGSH